MSVESVQVANDAVAQALQAVKDAEKEVAEWNEHVKSHLRNQETLTVVISERDKANERLDKANERLKEAREYYLQVSQQNQQNAKEMLVKELTYGKVNILLG
jgi:hypothetical protein